MILVDAERPPLFGGVHNHGARAQRPRGLARAAEGAVLRARANPVSSELFPRDRRVRRLGAATAAAAVAKRTRPGLLCSSDGVLARTLLGWGVITASLHSRAGPARKAQHVPGTQAAAT